MKNGTVAPPCVKFQVEIQSAVTLPTWIRDCLNECCLSALILDQ